MRWRVQHQADDVQVALRALSALLACGAAPGEVLWSGGAGGEAQADLLEALAPAPTIAPPEEAPPLHALRRLPAGFISLAEAVLMHADPQRFQRLHAYALDVAAEPQRWQDALDPRRLALEGLAREVRREIHKMHAFVRFRPLQDAVDDNAADSVQYVAWFEPEHHIVRAAVPLFERRFASMRWAILTPRLCAHWNGSDGLRFSPGVDRSKAPPPDAGEALWLDYYRSIFNPARLKVSAMLREMPRRYWPNLPEASTITGLIQSAPERSARMQQAVAAPLRRMPTAQPATPSRSPQSAAERLADLGRRARHCSDCTLAAHATQMVWGQGPVGAPLMIVGEQPDDQEDLAGRPFVGPAGQLLREALAELGWPVERLYLTNAVKHFRFEPRGKRRIHKTPGQREALACQQWLEAEVRLVAPQALLALGATAAASLLGRPVSVQDSLGQWWPRADGLPVWVVHHPAAVLRHAESGAPTYGDWVQALRPAMQPPLHLKEPAG
ncbi:UdgX family uracil-DNA binding protein [Hydrogenophaga palleronii]|uniref:UdgX family uracil-DNA binding protein n=1 Tax=Hydrogenophaga palleronii TaxID=65655 RepID=UPI00082448F3|nr:UdgX family uracil-DNA binding protein [Hydrogenophaga palleronii]